MARGVCAHCGQHWLAHSGSHDYCPRMNKDGKQIGWNTNRRFAERNAPPGSIVVNGNVVDAIGEKLERPSPVHT